MSNEHWHRRLLEGSAGLMAALSTVLISIGGLVEIVPMFSGTAAGPDLSVAIEVYTPLEVAGRDLYTREGCYTCHSQMVRPMRSETMRFGEWSRAWEYQYDRPFLLGSRRIGPDLHRLGGKYPDAWHYEHMRDPRSTSPGSVMPPYPWLLTGTVDPGDIQASMTALRMAGNPYTQQDIDNAPAAMKAQADAIVQRLAGAQITAAADSEIVAMIAYLQRLGKDRPKPVADAGGAP